MRMPAAFRYRRQRPFDHVAPSRWVILRGDLRAAIRRRWQRVHLQYLLPSWLAARPWVQGFAFVAVFLLAHGWLARRDLELDLAAATAAAHKSAEEAQHRKDELGQVRAAGNCQTLFYLVEAKNSREVFTKLTQAATQLDAARSAEWVPVR